jgi:hypothetical protein
MPIVSQRCPLETVMDHPTTTEAAVAAGVSLPQINRVIDEKILPDDCYSTSPTRTVRTDACLLIAFYFETVDWLTASARLKTIRNAVARANPVREGGTLVWCFTPGLFASTARRIWVLETRPNCLESFSMPSPQIARSTRRSKSRCRRMATSSSFDMRFQELRKFLTESGAETSRNIP